MRYIWGLHEVYAILAPQCVHGFELTLWGRRPATRLTQPSTCPHSCQRYQSSTACGWLPACRCRTTMRTKQLVPLDVESVRAVRDSVTCTMIRVCQSRYASRRRNRRSLGPSTDTLWADGRQTYSCGRSKRVPGLGLKDSQFSHLKPLSLLL